MEPDNDARIRGLAARSREKTNAQRQIDTRRDYFSMFAGFMVFAWTMRSVVDVEGCLTPAAVAILSSNDPKRDSKMELRDLFMTLKTTEVISKLDFVTASPEGADGHEMLVMYLTEISERYETANFYKKMSAVLNLLYVDGFKTPVPVSLRLALSGQKSGTARGLVEDKQNNGGRLETGATEMPCNLYQMVNAYFWGSADKDAPFALAYGDYVWNLASRTSAVHSARLEHTHIDNDAMKMGFVKSKTKQEGLQVIDSKCVFANHRQPKVCPFLSLAVFKAISGFKSELVFGDGASDAKYNTVLHRAFDTGEELRDFLKHRQLSKKYLTAHSLRKGALSLLASGVADPPSAYTVGLRGDHVTEQVTKVYIHQTEGGDRRAGRTLALLDTASETFADLPCHFRFDTPPSVMGSIVEFIERDCFAGIPEGFIEVGKTLLATLLFHRPFLDEILHPKHQLRTCAIFTSSAVTLQSFTAWVTVDPSERMQPTGLTALTVVSRRLGRLETLIEQQILGRGSESAPVDNIERVIERAAHAGAKAAVDAIVALDRGPRLPDDGKLYIVLGLRNVSFFDILNFYILTKYKCND
jgi:hypothetical protein